MSYQLTADDLDTSVEGETPTIRAVRHSNPDVLNALLAHYTAKAITATEDLSRRERKVLRQYSPNASVIGAITGIYESPLTAAIRANRPHYVRALLAAGADPNGITLEALSDYSVRFIRGRDAQIDVSSFVLCPPRATVLEAAVARGIARQTAPFTQQELDERRQGFPRFWTEPNVPGQRLRMTPARTALEVAAQCGREDMFELLRATGSDESAWQEDPGADFDSNPRDGVHSALSTSSPVHEALAAGHHSMLQHLLTTCRYSPNYRPRVAPTVALPPLSFALARCDLASPGVQACLMELLSHPQLDPHRRTPIFGVHALHLATARHNADLLEWLAASLPGGLTAAGTTALGHTLLHVAALPQTASQTVSRNSVVARSLHCARTLDETWLPHSLPSPLHTQFAAPGDLGASSPQPMTAAEQEAQRATIQVLLRWGGLDVRAQDVDGNTALHYLAGTLNVDEETVDLVRAMDGGEDVWQTVTNWCAQTPRQLWGE